MINKQF